MRARRRPFAAFFTAFLVWLTAVGQTRDVVPREVRLLSAGGEREPTISLAAPRTMAAVARDVSRLPVVSQADGVFLPARSTAALDVPVVAYHAHAAHSRVRRSQGLASTYDATAPPRRRA